MSIVPNFDWTVFDPKIIKPGDHLWRGERNNNPGNLVNTPETWQGEIVDGDDTKFMQFTTAVLGIRALAKLLLNYQKKYGLSTIEGLIGRWAPPNENDTEQYIKDVCKECGVTRDQKVYVADILLPLTTAIIRKECARVAYLPSVLKDGVNLALGKTFEEEVKENLFDGYSFGVVFDHAQTNGAMTVTVHIYKTATRTETFQGFAVEPFVVLHE